MEIKHLDLSNASERNWMNGILQRRNIWNFVLRPEFLTAFRDTYSVRCHYLLCMGDDDCSGIAAFYERKGLLDRDTLTSLPGGFWAGDGISEALLIKHLDGIARDRRLKGPYFKDLDYPLFSRELHATAHKAVRELPATVDELMLSHSKNIRRDIKNARRAGLTVEAYDEDEKFYAVWARNMRDLGTPSLPKSFFSYLRAYFKKTITTLLVKKDDTVIGGAFIFWNAVAAHDMYLSSLRSYSRFCPNILLYHEMFAWAIRNGIRFFDLGRSQPGSGNEIFKLRFGAKLTPLYCSSPNGGTEGIRFTRNVVVTLWKRMPLPIANRVGPVIRSYIPFG